jgi:hypothetical protein
MVWRKKVYISKRIYTTRLLLASFLLGKRRVLISLLPDAAHKPYLPPGCRSQALSSSWMLITSLIFPLGCRSQALSSSWMQITLITSLIFPLRC